MTCQKERAENGENKNHERLACACERRKDDIKRKPTFFEARLKITRELQGGTDRNLGLGTHEEIGKTTYCVRGPKCRLSHKLN